jgi:hypothetical protein
MTTKLVATDSKRDAPQGRLGLCMAAAAAEHIDHAATSGASAVPRSTAGRCRCTIGATWRASMPPRCQRLGQKPSQTCCQRLLSTSISQRVQVQFITPQSIDVALTWPSTPPRPRAPSDASCVAHRDHRAAGGRTGCCACMSWLDYLLPTTNEPRETKSLWQLVRRK